jgi:HK97 gp10 family phage protein
MMPRPGFDIDARDHRRALKLLGERVAKRVSRKAVTAGSAPIVKATRAGAPQESGLLAKSIGRKIKAFGDTGNAYAIVGARRDVVGEFNGQTRRPANYLHLIELGHINADGSFTPGNPFVKRASESTREQAQAAVRAKLESEIKREADRL